MSALAASVGTPSTAGAPLIVGLVALPMAAALAAVLLRRRAASAAVLLSAPILVGLAFAAAAMVLSTGSPIECVLGAWKPPLGIVLRADGLGTAMMVVTATIASAVALFAAATERRGAAMRGTAPGSSLNDAGATPGPADPPPGDHSGGPAEAGGEADGGGERQPDAAPERASATFWVLLASVWGALNLTFIANDLFTLFVALELLTFAAVPLVCLAGTPPALRAALRYLLLAMAGSMLYLLGVALVYGSLGALDLSLIAELIAPGTDSAPRGVLLLALVLATTGMLVKTALVPLHAWLPPAHAGAPPQASALLSALVVKGSWFVILRLWLTLGEVPGGRTVAFALAALGAVAILFGSATALRQRSLKLLVAWSTVAQIGYLFVAFPALVAAAAPTLATEALRGGMLQAISHAFAKAAMFLAAGLLVERAGRDRIDALGGAFRRMPIIFAAFAIGGLSLMGLPPSGGFWAKWLLLQATIGVGAWWLALTILAGGVLAGAYLLRVLRACGAEAPADLGADRAVVAAPAAAIAPDRLRTAIVLGLALVSMFLGFAAMVPAERCGVRRLLRSEPITQLDRPIEVLPPPSTPHGAAEAAP
ncbi:MAG TPA: proton-conducting transporter membrane subunit [Phycisphaerales bacterium]|nr:proton-conducting transporter membrane subunit [Phycisphaerales bacterium]HMP36684.1 proton-conducting transporter membrane subunit [Phycisphaerales bacterium]